MGRKKKRIPARIPVVSVGNEPEHAEMQKDGPRGGNEADFRFFDGF